MLTGTPLDLTPFGGVLAALGWLYWLLALGIVVFALWWPKRWWMKLASAAIVLSAVVYPVFIRPVEKHTQAARNEQEQFKAKLDAAMAQFDQRCKSAGEKIVRTVDNVEGVVWMKWREKRDVKDDYDQFKLFDPYGRDCDADECIAQLLRLETKTGRFQREVELRKVRYRYVEAIDGSDGKRYRGVHGVSALRPLRVRQTHESIEVAALHSQGSQIESRRLTMPNAVSTTFANLQMAAEASKLDQVRDGALSLEQALPDGNNRTSKFTTRQGRAVRQRVGGREQAAACHTTVNATSIFPRVAFEYGHTSCAAFTSASVAGFSMPGTVIVIATAMPKAPGLPTIGPIETSDLIDTLAGRLIFWRAATAFIAPMKHAE